MPRTKQPYPPFTIEFDGPKLPDAIQRQLDAAIQAVLDHSTERYRKPPMPRITVAGLAIYSASDIRLSISTALDEDDGMMQPPELPTR